MKWWLALMGLAVLTLTAAQARVEGNDGLSSFPFHYPMPEKWKLEVVGLPPDVVRPETPFPWKGNIVMLFAPAFFDSRQPEFQAMTYLWWIEGDQTGDREGFERDFRDVKFKTEKGAVETYLLRRQPQRDISDIHIDMQRLEPQAEKLGHTVWSYRLASHSYDPFVTLDRMTFYEEVHVWFCDVHNHTVSFFLRSPGLSQEPVKELLEKQFSEFQCHAASSAAGASPDGAGTR